MAEPTDYTNGLTDTAEAEASVPETVADDDPRLGELRGLADPLPEDEPPQPSFGPLPEDLQGQFDSLIDDHVVEREAQGFDGLTQSKFAEEQEKANQDPGLADKLGKAFTRGGIAFKQQYNTFRATNLLSELNNLDDSDKRTASVGGTKPKTFKPRGAPSATAGENYDYLTPPQRAALRAKFQKDLAEQIKAISARQVAIESIPQPPEVVEALEAKTFGEFWTKFKKAPLTFIATVGVESLPAMAPSLVAGTAGFFAAGPVGAGLGAGAGSFYADYMSQVIGALYAEGVNVRDPEALAAGLANKELMARVGDRAKKHAAGVAALDAVSAGVAGKVLLPAKTLASRPLTREGANIVVQLPVQGGLGATGEIAGSVASGQEIKPGDVGAEFFGEFIGAPAEVAGMRGAAAATEQPGVDTPAATPGTEPTLPTAPTPPPLPTGKSMLTEGAAALRKPAAPAKPTNRIVTPDASMEVEATPQVVDLADLIFASGDLQPRDRTRLESDVGVRERAANLDPSRLQPGRVSDAGAPIVAADGTIVSGNGRVMSIAEAYKDPALKVQADAYRASLGPEAEGMAMPVRVQRLGDMDPADLKKFADLSNRPATAQMSATERAQRDAKAGGPDIMGLYTGGSFTSPANRAFMRAFSEQVVGSGERGAFSKDGQLTKEGDDRMSAAVLAAAYGDSELLARMLESTDDNIRNVTGALRDASGAFTRLKQAVESGTTSKEFDISPQLAETAKRIADLRDRGIKPREFLAQTDAFSETDPLVAALLRGFYNDELSRPLSREKLTEFLIRYAEEAQKHTEQGLLPDPTTPQDVLAVARRGAVEDRGEPLFRPSIVRPDSPGAGRGVRGQEPAGSESDAVYGRFQQLLAAQAKPDPQVFAEALGIDEAALQPLIDQGIKDGLLRVNNRGQVRRTGKAIAPQAAKPQLTAIEPQTLSSEQVETVVTAWRDLNEALTISGREATRTPEEAEKLLDYINARAGKDGVIEFPTHTPLSFRDVLADATLSPVEKLSKLDLFIKRWILPDWSNVRVQDVPISRLDYAQKGVVTDIVKDYVKGTRDRNGPVLLKYIPETGRFLVLDGTHRATSERALGQKVVRDAHVIYDRPWYYRLLGIQDAEVRDLTQTLAQELEQYGIDPNAFADEASLRAHLEGAAESVDRGAPRPEVVEEKPRLAPQPSLRLAIPADQIIDRRVTERETQMRRAIPLSVVDYAVRLEEALGTPQHASILEDLKADKAMQRGDVHDLATLVLDTPLAKGASKEAVYQALAEKHARVVTENAEVEQFLAALGLRMDDRIDAQKVSYAALIQDWLADKQDVGFQYANEGWQQTKDIVGGTFVRFTITRDGEPTHLTVAANIVDDTAKISWIGGDVNQDPNTLGIAGVRQLREAIRKQFPNVKRFEGNRVSGARRKAQAEKPGDSSVNTLQSVVLPALGSRSQPSAKAIRQGISDMVKRGEVVKLPARVIADVHAAAEPLLPMVPEDTVVTAVARIEPVESGVVRLVLQERDGVEHSVLAPWNALDGVRAFHLPGRNIIGIVRYLPRSRDTTGNFDRNVAAELGHEVVHALRGSGRLVGETWTRLLNHAKSLQLLDGDFGTYLKTVDDPYADQVRDMTTREAYAANYSTREDFAEIMDQEEVTHLLEWHLRGLLIPEEIAPVRDLIEAILAGDMGAAAPDYASQLEEQLAALGATIVEFTPEIDDRGFFSPSLEAAKQIPQERGTVQQMKAMLLKYGGKPKELEAVGFDRAFPDPNAKVSRQEIEQYLRDNRVQLGATQYGGDAPAVSEAALRDEYIAKGMKPDQAAMMASKVARERAGIKAEDPKFESYSTPGGIPGSYREVVTTLPSKEGNVRRPNAGNWGDMANTVSKDDYTSSHWPGITNPLLHYRVKDFDSGTKGPRAAPSGDYLADLNKRVAEPNQKVRVLDEMQSDWAQRARDQGTRDPAAVAALEGELRNAVSERDKLQRDIAQFSNQHQMGRTLPPREASFGEPYLGGLNHLLGQMDKASPEYAAGMELFSPYARVVDKISDLGNKVRASKQGVPSAPYISNTSDWVDLGLKQALIDAAKDPSVSRLAWAPGGVQAQRYSLSKVVSELDVMPHSNGDRTVNFYDNDGHTNGGLSVDKDGNVMAGPQGMRGHKLEEVVGRELAAKIMGATGKDSFEVGREMGGEGMKSFYGDFDSSGQYIPGIVGTRLLKLVKSLDPEAAKIDPWTFEHDTPVRDLKAKGARTTTDYPSIRLTPRLREALLGGQPLFALGGKPQQDTPAIQTEAAHLTTDVSAFEQRLWEDGQTAEEISAALFDRYGFDVPPADLVAGRVWWKLGQAPQGFAAEYVDAYQADALQEYLAGQDSSLTTPTESDTTPTAPQTLAGAQTPKAFPRAGRNLNAVQKARVGALWAEGVSPLQIAQQLTEESGKYVRLTSVSDALASLGILDRGNHATRVYTPTVWTQATNAFLVSEEATRLTAAQLASRMEELTGQRITAKAVTRQRAKLRAKGADIPLQYATPSERAAAMNADKFAWTPEALARLTDQDISTLKAPAVARLLNAEFGGPPLTANAIRLKRSKLKTFNAAIGGPIDPEAWLNSFKETQDARPRSDDQLRGETDPRSGEAGAGAPGTGATALPGEADNRYRGRVGQPGRFAVPGGTGRGAVPLAGAVFRGRNPVSGLGENWYFAYAKEDPAFPSSKPSPERQLKIVKGLGNWTTKAHLIERTPGNWELVGIATRRNRRRRGLADRTWAAIEADLGITLTPPGRLNRDLYRFLEKKNPELVANYQRLANGNYYSPQQLMKLLTIHQEIANQSTENVSPQLKREIVQAQKGVAEISGVLDSLPAGTEMFNAALGGRGKPLDMSPEARKARAQAMGFDTTTTWYHGTQRLDRLTEKGKIDPKRATSGPMPFFTDDPEIASNYATSKPDTSRIAMDPGDKVANYFTVDSKNFFKGTRSQYTVEQTWNFLTPEQRRTIADRAVRIGYRDIDTADGPIILHPEGVEATLSPSHYEFLLQREERGNHLAALRNIWHDGGNLIGDEGELAHIYQLAGYPYPISQANAPWTTAEGVLPVYLKLRNPLRTDDYDNLTQVATQLEQLLKRDRTRKAEYSDSDMWDKSHRWTPKEWIAQLKEDMAAGGAGSSASYVFTSIPDKITAALRQLGYDGILDVGGKGGGRNHKVAVPFEPTQVRSVNAAFEEGKAESSNLLAAIGARPPLKMGSTRTSTLEAPEQTLTDLIGELTDALGLTSRIGRLSPGLKMQAAQQGGALMGQFGTVTGVVRTKLPNDLQTLAHEGGHALEVRPSLKADLDALKRTHANELTASIPDLSEGFAEFFRTYVTNPVQAQQDSPKFFADFEDLLDAREPAMLEALENVQAGVMALANASPFGIVRSREQSSVKPGTWASLKRQIADKGWGNTISDKLYGFYTAYVDSRHPMKRAVRYLLNTAAQNLNVTLSGKERLALKAIDDPYKLWRLSEHSKVWATADLQNGIRQKGDDLPSGPSFRDALRVAFGGGSKNAWNADAAEAFSSYLRTRRILAEFARHDAGERDTLPDVMIERNVWEKARNDAEAQYPQFIAAADLLYQFNQNLLKLKLDNGFLTPELYADLSQRIDYVPLNRVMDDDGPSQLTSARGQNKAKMIRQQTNSSRDFINALELIAQDVYATRARIALNDTIRAMDRLARAAGPGGGRIAERIPARDMQGTKVDIREVMRAAAKAQGLTGTAELESLNDVIDDLFDQDASATIFKATDTNEKGEPIVYLWEEGQRVPMRLGDDRIGRDIFEAFTAFGTENADFLMDMWAQGARGFRFGVTKAPAYIGVNFLRDQLATWALSSDYTPFVTGAKGLAKLGSTSDAMQRYNAFAGMAGVESDLINRAANERDALTLRRKGFTAAPTTFGSLLRTMEVTELASRLGHYDAAYQRALKDGFTPEEAATEAAYAAHDVLDFSRRGSKMMQVARLIPFLNSTTQGLDAARRTMSGERDTLHSYRDLASPYLKAANGHPLSIAEKEALPNSARIWVKLGIIGMIGASLAAYYRDDDEHEEFNDYMRATHWFFKVGGVWWRLPKPFELAILSNAFEAAYARYWKNDERALTSFLESMRHTMSLPSDIAGLKALGQLVEIPQKLWAKYVTKDPYHKTSGESAVPSHMRGLPPELQFTAYTSELGRLIGSTLNWSPAEVDRFMTNTFATLGRDALALSDQVLPYLNKQLGGILPGVSKEPRADKSLEDYWIVSRFTRREARASLSGQEYWKQMSRDGGTYVQAAGGYRYYLDQGKFNPIMNREAREFLDTLPPEQKAYAILEGNYKEGEQDLNPLNRARQVMSVSSGIRKDMVMGRLVKQESVKRGATPELITTSPANQKTVNEILEDLSMREARNALIVIGHPGWQHKNLMETDSLIAELHAVSPEIAKEFEYRQKTGKNTVYSFEAVKQLWPQARQRLLEQGEEARLSDLKAQAKALSRGKAPVTGGIRLTPESNPEGELFARPPGMMRLGGPLPPAGDIVTEELAGDLDYPYLVDGSTVGGGPLPDLGDGRMGGQTLDERWMQQ
jgi:hypothetical protein